MVAIKNHKALLKKLKRQVRVLQYREEKTRKKLRIALIKLRQLGQRQKMKLATKMRIMQGKIAAVQASTYAKMAKDIERQMMRNIEAKGKALKTAIDKLEKKHVAKLKQSFAKKSKVNARTSLPGRRRLTRKADTKSVGKLDERSGKKQKR